MYSTSTHPPREHLHQPGDDGLQQQKQFLVVGRAGLDLVVGRAGLDEFRRVIGAAAVHAVQNQAVQAVFRQMTALNASADHPRLARLARPRNKTRPCQITRAARTMVRRSKRGCQKHQAPQPSKEEE